jgi:hypothetical protein
MIAVYVAAFPAGGFVPLPRDSVLSGPHAPTTGHGGNPLPADAGPFPLFHRTRMFLFVTSVAGDTSGCLGYGTTSGAVAPGVEHAGDGVRLPGP